MKWIIMMFALFSSYHGLDQELPDVFIGLRCETKSPRVGEPLVLVATLTNNSKQAVWLDGRMIYKYHLRLEVHDSAGKVVKFKGWDTKVSVAPPAREDFVRLGPKIGIGRQDFTNGELMLPAPGKYKVYLRASHGASEQYAKKFGFQLCSFGAPASLSIQVTK